MSALFGATLALGAAACGDSGTTPCTSNADCGADQTCNLDTGLCESTSTECGGDCFGCRQDGECCDFSINCLGGSICNDTEDDLYDPDKEIGICVKVICATNADCEAPKTCSLQKICESPLCQTDTDCSGGNVCLGGSCTSAPNQADAASCQVLTNGGAIQQDASLELSAIAKNSSGVVLPLIQFEWTSDNTAAVGVTGNLATGGTTGGAAMISASVAGTAVSCNGGVSLNNFPSIGPNDARLVLVADGSGEPVSGAEVTIFSGGQRSVGTTAADGSYTATVAGDIDSLTATKDGWQSVSVISPATKNVFLPIPQEATRSLTAGGFRGNIDISKTKSADIKLGIVAPAIPSNLFDFDLLSLVGDFVPTIIDAEDLGLDPQPVPLPGGIVFGLSDNTFTDDSAQPGGGLRCQGQAPAVGELGCYAARAPAGPTAAWALAGQLKLSDVTPLVGTITSAIDGGGDDLPIGEILAAVLPLLQKLNHGINAGIFTTEFAKVPALTDDECNAEVACPDAAQVCEMALGFCKWNVDCTDINQPGYDDRCQGDFSKYEKVELAADAELAIRAKVAIPTLPTLPSGEFTGGAILLSAAIVPGQGIVPLGLSAGLDSLEDETPDGKIAGAEEPFGPESDPLEDGFMPLAMAPAHSGIEGGKVLLFALALDPATITDGFQFSGLVSFKDKINETDGFGNSTFMTQPEGTVSVANANFTKSKGAEDANLIRVELQNNGKTWLVYGPGGTEVPFPDAGSLRQEFMANGLDALIQAVRTPVSYADVFRFGSGSNLDNGIEFIEGLALQECADGDATAVCKIQ